jgi:hypothetical protein
VETRCATVAEDIVIINNASAGESAAELSNLRVGSMQIKNWPCFIGRCYIKLYKNRICGLELGWGSVVVVVVGQVVVEGVQVVVGVAEGVVVAVVGALVGRAWKKIIDNSRREDFQGGVVKNRRSGLGFSSKNGKKAVLQMSGTDKCTVLVMTKLFLYKKPILAVFMVNGI